MPTSARVWCVNFYISEHERQRRRRGDDTTFRPRPTETLPADRKGSQETLVSCALLGTFPAREKYPAGGMDKPILIPDIRQNGRASPCPDDGRCGRGGDVLLRRAVSAGLCFLARLARGAQRRDTHAGTETCHRHVSLASLVPCSSLCPRRPKRNTTPPEWCFFLERATRLELATSTLARSRSTR